MANRNNSARPKKTHGYRPYDASNSFVKRITAKVSEILPQPTSWVSRWFSPAPKLNAREREDDEEEDEEERQPPAKRLCFSTTETNEFTHLNNINRLHDLDKTDSQEISPIPVNRVAAGRDDDQAIAGPSGLHLRHFPISSTPAIRSPFSIGEPHFRKKAEEEQQKESRHEETARRTRREEQTRSQRQEVQARGREEASGDESESTSGCSSLLPGFRPRQELNTPQPSVSRQPSLPSPIGPPARRMSIGNISKANVSLNRTNLNLSTSSQPSFDPYVFINPLNRSGIKRRLGEESCFYPGNTTFGGSSAHTLSPVETTRVVNVKVSPIRQAESDTISASARKILRALEQFSTPVLDAKRMPIRQDPRSGEKRRRPPQPYEELIFPSMPELLKVKRQEEALKAASTRAGPSTSTSSPASTSASTSTSTQPSRGQELREERVPSQATDSSKHTQANSQSNPPSYQPFSAPSSASNSPYFRAEKGPSKLRVFSKEIVELVPDPPPVKLPDVKLPITTLPKIVFDTKKTDNEDKKDLDHQKPQSQTANLPASSPPFKFSQPQIVSANCTKTDSPTVATNKFKFSDPLEPEVDELSSPVSSDSITKPQFPQLQMKNPSPNMKLKRKTPQSSPVPSMFKTDLKPSEMKNASVMEFFNKKPSDDSTKSSSNDWTCSFCSSKNKETITSCSSCQKPKLSEKSVNEETWACLKCTLKNSQSDTKCKSCGLAKGEKPISSVLPGLGSFAKPKNKWECDTCLVSNDTNVDACVACSTPKPGASKKPAVSQSTFQFGIPPKSSEPKVNDIGTKPLSNSIKPPEGSWECSTCLVRNKKDDVKCAACSTDKPGLSSADKPSSKPAFSFGIPPSMSQSNGSGFKLPAASEAKTTPSFTFGMPPDNKNVASSIGASSEKKADTIDLTIESVPSSTVTTTTPLAPLVNAVKKPEGSWECDTCLVQNKKDSVSCAACGTTKPGCAPEKPKSTPTFSFGIPSGTPGGIQFGSAASLTTSSSITSSSSQPQFTFGNATATENKSSNPPAFNFTSNEPQKTNEIIPFTFTNSDQSKEKVGQVPNLFSFGSNATGSSKNEEMNDGQPSKKRVSFGNPLASEKNNLSNAIAPFGSSLNKANDNKALFPMPSNFTAVENSVKNDSAPSAKSPFSFGAPPAVNDLPASKPSMFGSTSQPPATAPGQNALFGNALGGFKPSEAENKPFSFLANSQPASGGFSFNPPAPAQGSQLFGAPAAAPAPAPLFSQPQPQEQKPFVFNAQPPQQQQPAQPVFSFTASHQQPAAPGGFNFSAPTNTPKFDPNVKPTFNFTGGTTPTFSAPPSASTPGPIQERKVRKAIRRTTAHR